VKIFITGCARSGTTLLRRLFYSFRDVEVIDHEISISEFARYDCRKTLVGKRNKRSFLSYGVGPKVENESLSLIAWHNIHIINLLRDGRDVIESKAHATPERWLASIDSYYRLKRYVDLAICYESLVSNPDKVQGVIVEVFGLEPLARFSEYPSFVPEQGFVEGPRYVPRPIDTSHVGKDYNWRDLVDLSLHKKFEDECRKYQELLKKGVL